MARLKFVPGELDGTFGALGMFAKDGEYVEFSQNCDCSGPVSHIFLWRGVVGFIFVVYLNL